MTTRFVPPHPPRGPAPVPVWRGFFGERARNAVYGWSAPMFENWHIRRNILGIVVHVVTHPDAVQRVLQTHAANYATPDIVKRVIAPRSEERRVGKEGVRTFRSRRAPYN